jgi:replicative DNA helicase
MAMNNDPIHDDLLSEEQLLARYYFHTPEDVSASYVEWANELQTTEGITFGVPSLDKSLLSLRPGVRMGIVARPGHSKTSFMAYMAKRVGEQIHAENADLERCIFFVTWDQQVEEIDTYFQTQNTYTTNDLLDGKVDMQMIRENAHRRLRLPVYSIGVSRRHRGYKRPPMPTMNQVANMIIDHRHEKHIQPALIIFDYIQKVPPEGIHKDRTSAVTEAIFTASDLALQLDSPLLIGVQAARATDDQRMPIPTMAHAQWASALEQEMDRLISLWMPIRSFTPQERPFVEIAGNEYKNKDELLVIRNLKQRFGRGYGLWPVRFDIPNLTMADYAAREQTQLGRWQDYDNKRGQNEGDDIPGFDL